MQPADVAFIETPQDIRTLADQAVEQAMSVALTMHTVRELSDIAARILARLDEELRAVPDRTGRGEDASSRYAVLQRVTGLMADIASACTLVNANLEVSAGVLSASVSRLHGPAQTETAEPAADVFDATEKPVSAAA